MIIEGNNLTESAGDIETLRTILEGQQSRAVTYEEAVEIGESLIAFFEVLGEDAGNETDRPDEMIIGDTA